MFAVCYIAATILTLTLIAVFGRKNTVVALFLGAIAFGILGFMMIPRDGLYVDTIRFFETLDNTRILSVANPANGWNYLMMECGYNATPVIGIIMYVIAQQAQNGWLTFLAAAIDVGAGFYLVYMQTRLSKNRSSLYSGIIVFLAILIFNGTVTGVRFCMAGYFTVCVIYRYSQKIDIRAVLLCIPAILIHPYTMLLLALYVISATIKKHKVLYIILCIPLLLQHYVQDAVFSIIDRFSSVPFFSSLSYKSAQYFGEDAYIVVDSLFSRIRSYALCVTFTVLIIMAIRKVRNLIPLQYIGFTVMLLCFTYGSYMDQQLFSRCVTILTLVVMPYICVLLDYILSFHRLYEMINVPAIIILFLTIIAAIDNLRAGIRFEVIQLSGYSIALMVVFVALTVCTLALCEYFERKPQVVLA